MARGNIKILETGRVIDGKLVPDKKGKDMPLNKYGKEDGILDWDAVMEEYEEHDKKSKNNKTMKNIFLDTSVKKQKFTPEVIERLNNIEFGPVYELMNFDDGNEGYLGAYSESEFFAYRFRKIHGFYPDLIRVMHVKTEKFLTELFKHVKLPEESFFKSYTDDRGEINLNSIVISIKTEGDDNLYIYMDEDEALFYYNKKYEKDPDSNLMLLLSLIKGVTEPKVTKNKIYVVYQNQGGFEKTGFDVKKINVDLQENYNEGFTQVSDEIISGLNDKKKTNLVILSGDPGTGKTTYIRHLTSKIKKNIIFIAPDMVNHITDPSFIPFLIKNSDAVLIIEDGEKAVKNGFDGRSGAVSNILNLTDGLLSDCLNISIVVTLNTNEKNIDSALLRRGRLLKNYKFEKLGIDKSKALLKKLGRGDVKVNEPMSLADIYFEGDNNSETLKARKVGFGNN